VEADLTQAIGPLAHVLVKKTVPRATTAQELRELLAVSIQDPLAREGFVHPKSTTTTSSRLSGATSLVSGIAGGGSRTRPLGTSSSMPLSQPLSQPLTAPQSGTRRTDTVPPSMPVSGTTTPSSAVKVHTFSAEVQTQLERALSQHIGPLAKTLVRKEAARQPHWNALLQALAQQVDDDHDRAQFLSAANRIAH
jgi:hypothetical protein